MNISIKRVYEEPEPGDGLRMLVDRLWPRGLSKEDAKIDVWLKSVAPSNDLRKWYQHDVQKWPEFKKRYFSELDAEKEALSELFEYIKKGKVTFLYSAKEQLHNNAVALKEYIDMVLS
ncbi:DUF488 domain-containing protein [Nitrosomonas sp. Nm132]|jgi:uncharacterized protein YeaO (DUF488 family)|uniref:DUF488 domain-containing protein n=1 Tax=Nitrosomonas sp. Nm132 TaxID=1881053 RepID=UPI000B80B400|nr:DUF488 domain-containing protein [Nitrosomonas sp. Nm132]